MFKFLVIVSTTVLSIVLSHPFDACIGKCPQSKNPFEPPTLLAHQDCTKYCFCNDGCPTVKTCPGNFHFSMDERVCLPIELAKCDDRRNCLGMCPIVYNTHNVFILPHSNSSKFCHCREWGVPTVETCPESLVFNIKYASCQKPIPDCHNVEIGAPTVRSVGGVMPPTIPPILPGDLDGPILIFPEDGQTSTSANSVSEDGITVSVPSTETSDSDSTTPVINNKDETTESKEEPTTNEPNPEDLTTIKSNIDDATTTVPEIKVPDSGNLVTDAPNDEDSTTLKSKIDVVIPTVASTSQTIEIETTVAPKIEDSTTVKSKIDYVIPTVASTSQTNEIETTVAPKIEDSTTVKSKINYVIPTVGSTWESNEVETTVAPKVEDSTTLKSKIDVVIPTVASTSKSNQVETTVAPKIEDTTTPKAPSNGPKIRIVPCNCTQTVFVDNNPPIPKKVHVNYLPSEVDDCIGQCPVENDVDYTKHLPHKDCEQYCKCDWGKATVMRCPYNLHFNRDLEVCDYPIYAKCSGIGAITTL